MGSGGFAAKAQSAAANNANSAMTQGGQKGGAENAAKGK